ncbi:MAG TPA: DUF1003 domain-containing protein [Gaiellaceae bacterium]|nr:DUF1003 domain-containing protein [Gaiellaceae bacterium]
MAAAAQTHHGAFGQDSFGRFAERVARFFGTPQYIVGQTIVVICWIAFNTAALGGLFRFDPEPYILLNLVFSTQAAYAAPLILLAQTRQADRDKVAEDTAEQRHDRAEHAMKAETDHLIELLQSNTQLTTQDKELTEHVAELTREIHALICKPAEPAAG